MRINEFKQGLQLTRDLANNESESNEKKSVDWFRKSIS